MGRPRKNPEVKVEIKSTEKVKVSKTKSTENVKEEPKKSSSFSFGGMSKEERQNVILNALNPKPSNEPIPVWTVEETEYEPQSWVVVLTIDGHIYQEPVPRYCNEDIFISLLSMLPDKVDKTSNKITVSAEEICKTEFPVKGVDCYINTVAFNGTRSRNQYCSAFDIKNTTKMVGGNIVFSGLEKGLTKVQCKKVVEAIVKKLNTTEISVDCK